MLIGWLAGVVCAQRALYCLPCHLFLQYKSRNILCLSSPRRPQWASSFWQLLPVSHISQCSVQSRPACFCAVVLWYSAVSLCCLLGRTGVPAFSSCGEVQLLCSDNIFDPGYCCKELWGWFESRLNPMEKWLPWNDNNFTLNMDRWGNKTHYCKQYFYEQGWESTGTLLSRSPASVS